MNRKLHNTASALLASGLMFALASLATPEPRFPAATPVATAPVAAEQVMDTLDADQAAARPARISARRIRQSMAMPFFSFAARG